MSISACRSAVSPSATGRKSRSSSNCSPARACLILDEPTKVLAPQETEGLFRTIAEFAAEGYGLIFITHKLREVIGVRRPDRGDAAGPHRRRDAEREQASEAGLLASDVRRGADRPSPAAVRRRGKAARDGAGARRRRSRARARRGALRDLSLRLQGGEILGVAGVSGNGQRELAELILGLRRPSRGVERLWGEDASGWSVARIRESGVASIPDDPLALALVPGLTVRENFGARRRHGAIAGLAFDWPRLVADMAAERRRASAFPRPLRYAGCRAFWRQSAAGRPDARARARPEAYRRALSDPRSRRAQHGGGASRVLRGARRGARRCCWSPRILTSSSPSAIGSIVLRDGRIAGEFRSAFVPRRN